MKGFGNTSRGGGRGGFAGAAPMNGFGAQQQSFGAPQAATFASKPPPTNGAPMMYNNWMTNAPPPPPQ